QIKKADQEAEHLHQLALRLRALGSRKAAADATTPPKPTKSDNKWADRIADISGLPKDQVVEAIQGKKAETAAPSPGAEAAARLLRTARTDSEFHDLVARRTKPDLIAVGKAAGLNLNMRMTKAEMEKQLKEATYTPGGGDVDVPSPEQAARLRQHQIDQARALGKKLATADYLHAQQASPAALREQLKPRAGE